MNAKNLSEHEKLEEILLQLIAEYHQGLNELAGHGTSTEQAIEKLETMLREARVDEAFRANNPEYITAAGEEYFIERIAALVVGEKP